MSGHSHSHDEPSHGHDHGGVPCGGHEQEPMTAEEVAAHKAEKASFDKTVKAFYHYEAHSVRKIISSKSSHVPKMLNQLPRPVVCEQPATQGLSR